MYSYSTKGVCATEINFDVEDNLIKSVNFVRGCNGSLQAVSKLVIGLTVDDAINKLEGIKCGSRNSSCPDQLSMALKSYKNDSI